MAASGDWKLKKVLLVRGEFSLHTVSVFHIKMYVPVNSLFIINRVEAVVKHFPKFCTKIL